jgi:PIN domain nuclease of toxin-antitoxin system
MGKSYLLDTHCLMWYQGDHPRLPKKIKELIEDPNKSIYFSQINLYEIAIKQKIGKLPSFKSNIRQVYDQAIKDDFIMLNITNDHLIAFENIPLIEDHRDPFDILLIATAHEENLIILTNDDKFLLYPELVKCLW